MTKKILYIYQFATMGGVERILLNRAEALSRHGINIKIDIFFYEDYGAVSTIKRHIDKMKLSRIVRIINEHGDLNKYDYIVVIDTPYFFKLNDINNVGAKIYIETHTAIAKNRKYLRELNTDKIDKIIIPSNSLKNILKITNNAISDKFTTLHNFIPSTDSHDDVIDIPIFDKNYIFFLGRIDPYKNVSAMVDFVKYYNDNVGELTYVAIGKQADDLENKILKNNVYDKILMLPQISFVKVNILLNTMKRNKAVFVSSSLLESFGMSALEAMHKGVPVLLSDIAGHNDVVSDRSEYLYRVNDKEEFSKKLSSIFTNYDQHSKDVKKLSLVYSEELFIEQWKNTFSA